MEVNNSMKKNVLKFGKKRHKGLAHLKQVSKEVYKNVKSYKIAMIPPLKLAKILN